MLISAEERLRSAVANNNSKRRDFGDPLDHRLECALGRARVKNELSEAEYQAGVKWRNVHLAYMRSIMDPDQLSDDECEKAAISYGRGVKILEREGKRVLHAVNAVAVFDEPEELGDREFTLAAAKIGLQALSISF